MWKKLIGKDKAFSGRGVKLRASEAEGTENSSFKIKKT
jgi:hypothetical protein